MYVNGPVLKLVNRIKKLQLLHHQQSRKLSTSQHEPQLFISKYIHTILNTYFHFNSCFNLLDRNEIKFGTHIEDFHFQMERKQSELRILSF